MHPAERRSAILDAAVAEIAERGFARTTSRHVAARAGVTHGLLHHYFPDHDTLLAAAFEKVAVGGDGRGARGAGVGSRPVGATA